MPHALDLRRRRETLWIQGPSDRRACVVFHHLLDRNALAQLLVSKLRFTSGSLAHYLNVQYSEKLPSSSTVDDVEGTLAKFIPSGAL